MMYAAPMVPIAGTAAIALFILLASRNAQRNIEQSGVGHVPRTWRRY